MTPKPFRNLFDVSVTPGRSPGPATYNFRFLNLPIIEVRGFRDFVSDSVIDCVYLYGSPGSVTSEGGRHRDVERVRQLLPVVIAPDCREKSTPTILIRA